MKGTFNIEGQTARTSSTRRYVVFVGRTKACEVQRWDYRTQSYSTETVEAFGPEIYRRSDDYLKACAIALKRGRPSGGYCVVVDTHTGVQTAC